MCTFYVYNLWITSRCENVSHNEAILKSGKNYLSLFDNMKKFLVTS